MKIYNNDLEILIDDDYFKREFYIYIINHDNKTFRKYITNTIPDTINFVIEQTEKYNIRKKIGTYLSMQMFYTFKDISYWTNENIVDRKDIYLWRMELPTKLRSRTDAIYYYTSQGYKPIVE